MNFYEERFKEIKKLIIDGKLLEALKIIEEELAIPYVPLDFETELKKLKKEIILNTLETTKDQQMVLDPIILFSFLEDERISLDEKVGLVKQLDNVNLRKYLSQIQELLLSDGENEVKALVLYYLSIQKVDAILEYRNYRGVILKIDLTTFDFAKQEEIPMLIVEQQRRVFYHQSVQLFEVAKQITIALYYKVFPLLEPVEIDLISLAIMVVTCEINGVQEFDFFKEKTLKEKEKINAYAHWIKEMID